MRNSIIEQSNLQVLARLLWKLAAMLTPLGVQHGTFKDALLGGTTIEDVVEIKCRRLGGGIAGSGAGCNSGRRKPQRLPGCRVDLDAAGRTCWPIVVFRRSDSAANLRKPRFITFRLLASELQCQYHTYIGRTGSGIAVLALTFSDSPAMLPRASQRANGLRPTLGSEGACVYSDGLRRFISTTVVLSVRCMRRRPSD